MDSARVSSFDPSASKNHGGALKPVTVGRTRQVIAASMIEHHEDSRHARITDRSRPWARVPPRIPKTWNELHNLERVRPVTRSMLRTASPSLASRGGRARTRYTHMPGRFIPARMKARAIKGHKFGLGINAE